MNDLTKQITETFDKLVENKTNEKYDHSPDQALSMIMVEALRKSQGFHALVQSFADKHPEALHLLLGAGVILGYQLRGELGEILDGKGQTTYQA